MSRCKIMTALAATVLAAACGMEPTTVRPSDAASRSIATSAVESTLTVTIYGPSQVRPGDECTWYAVVSGAPGPYEYWWSTLTRSTDPYGPDATFTTSFDDIGPEGVYVSVRTVGGGVSGSDGHGVYVSRSAPAC